MDGEAAAVTGEENNQAQPVDPAQADSQPAEDAAPAGGLTLGEDGQPIQQEEETKVEEIITEEVLRDMENVWAVFDL